LTEPAPDGGRAQGPGDRRRAAGKSMITKDLHRISCESFVIMGWSAGWSGQRGDWGATPTCSWATDSLPAAAARDRARDQGRARMPRQARRNHGINTLLWLVGVLTVKDMRTTREQKEANTVYTDKVQANLKPETQRRFAQRAIARIERDYPWSRPSRVPMSCCLGISYATGTGRVPV
jgi:hypothetical protein